MAATQPLTTKSSSVKRKAQKFLTPQAKKPPGTSKKATRLLQSAGKVLDANSGERIREAGGAVDTTTQAGPGRTEVQLSVREESAGEGGRDDADELAEAREGDVEASNGHADGDAEDANGDVAEESEGGQDVEGHDDDVDGKDEKDGKESGSGRATEVADAGVQSETGHRVQAGDGVQGGLSGVKDEAKRAKKKARSKEKLKAMEEKQRKRGVCYLSRVPPHMKPLKLRHLLEPYGEILRIYLAPEDTAIRMRRKRAGKDSGKNFTEGWVEFASKKVAKRVADLLNGESMERRKRSAYHYDLWNIKYLHKFKWDNLTEEIAYRNAVREQKLAAELSQATKERDFYLARVDQSRAIKAMAERKRKREGEGKVKVSEGATENAGTTGGSKESVKVMRRFAQRAALHDPATMDGPRLPASVLKKVWGGGSAEAE